MKRFILIFTVLLCTTSSIYSQGLAELTGILPGRNLENFFDPCNGQTFTAYAGVILCNFEGNANTPFYCLDLCTGIAFGDILKDSAGTVPKAIYILRNYYPSNLSAPGALPDDNDEAAAVQCAIWNIRNDLDVTVSVGNVTVRDRALEIIADANANGTTSTIPTTFKILPGGNFNEFVVQTTDEDGNGIAVSDIDLTITAGTLSTNVTSTNASGLSDPIVVTGSNTGTITATAEVVTSVGFAFAGYTENVQVLGLARTTTGLRSVSADWGLLPVELGTFTANVINSTVNLNWGTISESNNSGFNIERKLVNSTEWKNVGFVEGNGTTNTPLEYFFSDRNVATGNYNYRLKQIDFNGNFEYHNLTNEVEVGLPSKYDLSQNYPNPFNPETKINFELPSNGFVTLKVFDISGKEVATIVNEEVTAGFHSVQFNGAGLSSGVYYYRLEANGFLKVMKMALIK